MIQDQVRQIVSKASGLKEGDIKLEIPKIEKFGDFSTNVALGDSNPKKKSEEIVSKIKKDKKASIFSKIEIKGPGFINFFLSDDYLIKNLKEIVKKGSSFGASSVGKGKTVLIEYSSPNIAKHFSVGHLRSTIIGQALVNLYTKLGYKVIGENHLGDWGTQFGFILAAIDEKKLDPKILKIKDLEKLYVDFNKKQREDPSLREVGKAWFKKLEDGDKRAREVWKVVKNISLKEFKIIYDLLGVNIENAHGESFYEDKMGDIIDLAKHKKISKKSQGALIIELKDMPPVMLLKSDGSTTYQTRDMAALKYRIDTWNPDIIVYEVGVEQSLHFKQIFKASEILGTVKDTKLIHVAHGLFLLEGKKMSTRMGTTIKLEELLKKSIEKARDLGSKDEEIAKKVGIGAIKYFDLLHSPTSSINFTWKEALSLEGNSAPYIQYTCARAKSVINKSKKDLKGLTFKGIGNIDIEELEILRELVKFENIILESAQNFSPNLLVNYVYKLSKKFNNFYANKKIIKAKNSDFRIYLTYAVSIIVKNSLNILGIEAPEKM